MTGPGLASPASGVREGELACEQRPSIISQTPANKVKSTSVSSALKVQSRGRRLQEKALSLPCLAAPPASVPRCTPLWPGASHPG